MSKHYVCKLDSKSIGALETKLRRDMDYKKKLDELCKRLASMGATNASLGYSSAIYNGKKDIKVSVKKIENGYQILASGESVLFVEFGSGITFGYGHPQAGEFGYGPGTYPTSRKPNKNGFNNWNNPNGWWIPKANGGGHTYGNPPSKTMYETAKGLKEEILEIAKAVLET